MRDQWDAKSVRKEMARAYRVLHATTTMPGHKPLRAAMPAYEYSASDRAEQLQAEVAARARGETTMHDRLASRYRPSAEEISRANIVLGVHGARSWLAMAEAYPEHQAVLEQAVLAAARGIGDRRLCRDRGWNLSTFQRYRDHAAQVIATHLNRAGLRPWV